MDEFSLACTVYDLNPSQQWVRINPEYTGQTFDVLLDAGNVCVVSIQVAEPEKGPTAQIVLPPPDISRIEHIRAKTAHDGSHDRVLTIGYDHRRLNLKFLSPIECQRAAAMLDSYNTGSILPPMSPVASVAPTSPARASPYDLAMLGLTRGSPKRSADMTDTHPSPLRPAVPAPRRAAPVPPATPAPIPDVRQTRPDISSPPYPQERIAVSPSEVPPSIALPSPTYTIPEPHPPRPSHLSAMATAIDTADDEQLDDSVNRLRRDLAEYVRRREDFNHAKTDAVHSAMLLLRDPDERTALLQRWKAAQHAYGRRYAEYVERMGEVLKRESAVLESSQSDRTGTETMWIHNWDDYCRWKRQIETVKSVADRATNSDFVTAQRVGSQMAAARTVGHRAEMAVVRWLARMGPE